MVFLNSLLAAAEPAGGAAVDQVVARHPDVLYLIAGQTHPEIAKREGLHRLTLAHLARLSNTTEEALAAEFNSRRGKVVAAPAWRQR